MSIQDPHVAGCCVLNVGEAGPVPPAEAIIGDITSTQVNHGAESIREVVSGAIFPQLSRITNIRPVGTFTTVNPRQYLEFLGGVARCSAAGETFTMYIAKRECDGIASGNVHTRYLADKFIVVPRTLTLTHPNNAELSFEVYAVSTDGSAPLVKETNQALPTPLGTNERYEFGKMTIAGNANPLQGKRDFTLDFGVTLLQESSDSEVYDSFVGVQQSLPQFTIGGVDPDWIEDQVKMDGTTVGTHANTILYLKNKDQPEANAAHIKMTTEAMWVAEDLVSGAANELATFSIRGESHLDASETLPVVFTVNSIIS